MVLAAFFLSVVFVLRGCMNGLDRPGGHGDVTLAISAHGDAIVFNAVGKGGRDLYLLDMATRQVTRIAARPDYEVDPALSPDGKTVVYAAGRPGDRADHFFLRSLDGKTVKQLTAEDANDASPTFSPDGSLIAFTRDKTYNWGGLEYWPEGASGVSKESLWEVDVEHGTPREIAGYSLFDDPLHWRPGLTAPTKAP